jgi:hypothetical protein
MERIGTVAASVAEASLRTPSNSHGVQANEIVPISDGSRLPPLHMPEIERIDRLVVVTYSSGQKELLRPLNDESRSTLARRIYDPIEPCREDNRDGLLGAISGMLGAYPMNQRYDRIVALSMAAAYLWTARDQPPWAILRACDLVRGGKAGLNLSFCPSEPEFNAVAARCVEPYRDELRRSRELLDAKAVEPPPPKLSREEIEAKLGAPPPADRCYSARALSGLDARKGRREVVLPDLPLSVPSE